MFIREGQVGSFQLPPYSDVAAILSSQAVPAFRCGLGSQHWSCAASSRSVVSSSSNTAKENLGLLVSCSASPGASCAMMKGLNEWSCQLLRGPLLLHTVSVLVSQQLWTCEAIAGLLGQFGLFTSLPPSSAPQVWLMQCWLLCLQFMGCTPHSTQSCSTPSSAHPDTYLLVRKKMTRWGSLCAFFSKVV